MCTLTGYLHGGVRSSNIVMDNKCNAKLIQFGVAMLMTKETYMKETRAHKPRVYRDELNNL